MASGSWRDTLFVWSGPLQLVNNKAEAEWSGSWVGCEDCPDANDAQKPSPEDLANSKMQFDVKGKLQQKTSGGEIFHHLCLDDGGDGWDLASGDDVQRHGDKRHTIVLPTIHRSDAKGKRLPIAAVGENDFGSFVSAGYMEAKSKGGGDLHMTLARRYLEEGDARSKWTAQMLYTKICSNTCTSSDGDDLPWRSHDLHALLRPQRRGKRKAASSET